MGQLPKKFAMKMYYLYVYDLFWTVIMLRTYKDSILESVSDYIESVLDYIEDFHPITIFAIFFFITLCVGSLFGISLLQIIFISPLIFIFILFILTIYCYSGVTESVCIGGVPHTWIRVGEHEVSEPWDDKHDITYWVADFECSLCNIKKEETVESIEKRNRINKEKKWGKW